MSNEIVRIAFNAEQVSLIKQQIAPKATDAELQLFLYQCQQTGLNPLTRQIYCIHRWTKDGDKMTVQTSIDGFRVIAERSGNYAGQSEPEFIDDDKGALKCCKVRVFKFGHGQRYEAAVGVAYWSEYVQMGKDSRPSGLWAKMPHTMLAKVAEALALRKAFPQDLSGLYTGDEMQQADTQLLDTNVTQDIDVDYNVPTREERSLLRNLVNSSDLADDERVGAYQAIDTCINYKMFEKIQHRLEARQRPIDQIVNPNAGDVNKHLKNVQTLDQ